MAVSRRLRFEILRRDAFTCRYCGAKAPEVTLTVDHVIPVALGGGDEPNNLVTACQPCNAGKSSIAPDAAMVDDVDAAALLFAKAKARAVEIRRSELVGVAYVCDKFDAKWRNYHVDEEEVPRPDGWADDIERFLAEGLVFSDLERMTVIAMNSKASMRNVWRYFCGCCWNEIGRRDELARQLIEDGEV